MHQMGEVTDEVPSPATIAQNRYDNLAAGGSLRNSIKSPIEDNRQSNVGIPLFFGRTHLERISKRYYSTR